MKIIAAAAVVVMLAGCAAPTPYAGYSYNYGLGGGHNVGMGVGVRPNLGGAAGLGYGPKRTVGALGGGVAGGLAGSAFGSGTGRLVAVGIGSVLGAFLGSEAGASLDRADELYARQAVGNALAAPVGQPISWTNPQSGNYGTVVPVRQGWTPTGAQCREFQQTVFVGGRATQAYGTACQQPDGTWKIVG